MLGYSRNNILKGQRMSIGVSIPVEDDIQLPESTQAKSNKSSNLNALRIHIKTSFSFTQWVGVQGCEKLKKSPGRITCHVSVSLHLSPRKRYMTLEQGNGPQPNFQRHPNSSQVLFWQVSAHWVRPKSTSSQGFEVRGLCHSFSLGNVWPLAIKIIAIYCTFIEQVTHTYN